MFANRGVCWRWHAVILHLLCLVACCRYLKGGMYLLGKLLIICVAWDLCQLFPPGWSLGVLDVPLYPFGCMQGELWILRSGSSSGGGDGVSSGSRRRLSPASVPASVGSFCSRSHWRWGLCCSELSRSMSSSSARVVWASLHCCAQSTISCSVALVCC